MPFAMGEVYVRVRVHGLSGSRVLERVLVDTGAIHSMLERRLADDLGIRPEAHGRFAIIGGSVDLPLGIALLEMEGRSFRVPVILGDQNLIGLTTLETLGFAVNPIERKLVQKPGVIFRLPDLHEPVSAA